MRFDYDNFLIGSDTAKRLYSYAKDMPICDFHCHLDPKLIYEDNEFTSITKLWLGGDHYKWRAMRIAGVPEHLVSGNGGDYERFYEWAKVNARLAGSPLYLWTAMELKRYFDIDEVLTERNAKEIYEACNKAIKNGHMSPVSVIKQSNVKYICTTDDPIDSLEYHTLINKREIFFKVYPAFRPDRALDPLAPDFYDYMNTLSEVSGVSIFSFDTYMKALINRLEFFAACGCTLSDHGLDVMGFKELSVKSADRIFNRILRQEKLSADEAVSFRYSVLRLLAKEYKRLGITMQLHMGARRSINKQMLTKLGPNTGFDIMNDFQIADTISEFLDACEQDNALPKTILFSLNEKDNPVLASIAGSFTGEGIKSKLQMGSAWWHNDHVSGIKNQLKTAAVYGLLPYFIGMLTDSRSFTSYCRHDFFRRLLSGVFAEFIDSGEYAAEEDIIKELMQDISYNNAVRFCFEGDVL